jgi:hypothetical protein
MKTPIKSNKIIYETIQKVVTCHPQLDWGSHNSFYKNKLRDSLFQGNDNQDTFWIPSFNISFYEKSLP